MAKSTAKGKGATSKTTAPKAPENEAPKAPSSKAKAKVMFYWLKVRTYVTPTETWEAGFYRVNGVIPMLENQPVNLVETYEDEVPEYSVYKMAEKFLINTDGGRGKLRPVDEVLEEMVIDKDTPQG